MAVFSEETRLYEVLIRVNEGIPWAAQYQTITEVKKDGVVISATIGDVAPVADKSSAEFDVIAQLIGHESAGAMLEIQRLNTENESLRSKIEALSSELTNAKSVMAGNPV